MYALFKDGKIQQNYIMQVSMLELEEMHRNAIGIPQLFAVDTNNKVYVWPKAVEGYTIEEIKE